jgi:hypothetical protein
MLTVIQHKQQVLGAQRVHERLGQATLPMFAHIQGGGNCLRDKFLLSDPRQTHPIDAVWVLSQAEQIRYALERQARLSTTARTGQGQETSRGQ